MKKAAVVLLLSAIGIYAWFSLPSPPRPPGEERSGGHAHAGDPDELADGVVLAVDKAANSVTISHGPLYSLGMPPMTMGFQAGNPDLLERVKPGDKVKFHVDVIGGAFTVMSIEPAN
jgi:Cu/Ag efflux protein CusF